MRVFVVGTGRCGTMTFAEACKHVSNYASGHETRALKPACFDYPDQHIEIDGRLSRCIFALVDRYPDAIYVHLIRQRRPCVESLADWGVAHQYALWVWGGTRVIADTGGNKRRTAQDIDRPMALEIADVLWLDVNRAIKAAIPEGSLEFRLEEAAKGAGAGDPGRWQDFWRLIGAEGDYGAGLQEFGHLHNARSPRTSVWSPDRRNHLMKTEPIPYDPTP